ncbi:MAG TPA: NapC/NirT family cytochrome c [Thermoanaerobaculia bacterium]|nr:NapC/NirT family cytochrome c [Thermoanaerobaculia bacterium]
MSAKPAAPPKQKLPHLSYNPVSAIGAAIALIAALTFGVLLVMSLYSAQPNPYYGIFMYMALPPVLVAGLLLIPLGMFLRWRRVRRTGEVVARWPRLDFNDPRHRNAAIVFVLGTLVFAVIMAVGSYGAYHYSESVTFCGTTCHQVMEPEFVTYQSSPHARVACTECHVGPGADWYVKSKLSGAYQIYAAAAETYPRPIPTPIESLRPAQETCEQCHWPEKIYGAQQRQRHHFLYDEDNTHWPINLLIKTGGGDPVSGQTAGIHWHMNIGVDVDYIARDERRQEIPWIRVRDHRTGRITIYQDADNPLSEAEVATATPRRMDCMDCHNRPSHIFLSPDQAVDEAILQGRIDRRLPAIKAVAVGALAEEYPSKEEALRQIASRITDHYRLERPQAWESERAAIDRSIAAVQEVYAGNIFPLMKASWSAYPNNLGHFQSVGCMRCHEGQHLSAEGVAVTHDCNACHLILSQGPESEVLAAAGLDFQHPEDLGGMELEVGCYECHTGVQP